MSQGGAVIGLYQGGIWAVAGFLVWAYALMAVDFDWLWLLYVGVKWLD